MKKRTMKKYIPKHTMYCKDCRWLKHIKTMNYHRATYCPCSDTCEKECWTTTNTCCKVRVYKCEHLGYIDETEESLLWDGCKECNVSLD